MQEPPSFPLVDLVGDFCISRIDTGIRYWYLQRCGEDISRRELQAGGREKYVGSWVWRREALFGGVRLLDELEWSGLARLGAAYV